MSKNSDKRIRPVMPSTSEMAETFEEMVKAKTFIVITITDKPDGTECSRIHHEMNSSETANELEFWAEIYRGKTQTEQEIKDLFTDQ